MTNLEKERYPSVNIYSKNKYSDERKTKLETKLDIIDKLLLSVKIHSVGEGRTRSPLYILKRSQKLGENKAKVYKSVLLDAVTHEEICNLLNPVLN